MFHTKPDSNKLHADTPVSGNTEYNEIAQKHRPHANLKFDFAEFALSADETNIIQAACLASFWIFLSISGCARDRILIK